MSIRTYFDNNFFHSIHEWPEADKDLVARAFSSRRYSLYPSIELFAELVSILNNSGKRGRLVEKAAFLLRLMMGSGRVLNYCGSLVEGELLQKLSGPFLDAGRTEKLKELLVEISRGEIPSVIPPLLPYVQKRKEEDQIEWQGIIDILRKYYEEKYGQRSPKDRSFEQFCLELPPEELFREVLRRKTNLIPCEAEEIVRKPQIYRYSNAIAKSIAAWIYLNVFVLKDRLIKHSDTFDVQQLVYLLDMDLLVSDDENMAKACRLVYGDRLRIVTPKDFLAELRGVNEVAGQT